MKKILLILLISIVLIASGCAPASEESNTQKQVNTQNSQESNEEPQTDSSSNEENEEVISQNEDSNIQETSTNSQESNVESNDNSQMTIIEVDAFNFGYSLEEIRVKKGEKVKIIMKNTGGRHDLVIDEYGRTAIVGAGETSEFEFTADEAGEFFYYCSVGSHRAAGMEGKLIVE